MDGKSAAYPIIPAFALKETSISLAVEPYLCNQPASS